MNAPVRLPTRVAGLDTILHGGLLAGSIVLVSGPAGTGKTVLACEMAFRHVAAGGRAVYITQMGELHSRLLAHLSSFAFFDRERVGRELVLLSGMAPLDDGATSGLMEMVRDAVRTHHPTLLVIDEVMTAEIFAESPRAFERLVAGLQALVAVAGCTAILLRAADTYDNARVAAIVDAAVELLPQREQLRTNHELEVVKLRGSTHATGRHAFEIGPPGMTVYPRIEAVWGKAAPEHDRTTERLTSGSAELDAMLAGGWPRGSSTLVLGATGAGKTLFGLSFVCAGAARGEKSVVVTCIEDPARLANVARAAGLPLDDGIARGDVSVLWDPRSEQLVDRIATRLLDEVKRVGATRVLLDSIDGLLAAATHPRRMGDFFAALANELRHLGATALFAEEIHERQGALIDLPIPNVSGVADNIVLLRSLQSPAGAHRFVTIRKLRGSSFDNTTHELWLTNEGVRIAPDADSAVSLLAADEVAREFS